MTDLSPDHLVRVLEALLMASERPLSVEVMQDLLEVSEPGVVRRALSRLTLEYAERAVELREVAGGYRFQVTRAYAEWVHRLSEERPPRYSRALLETLALIAYRQPITRGEIEAVRGVSVSASIIKTLVEREWVRVVGHRDSPGKPAIYGTTKQFLDHFNLRSLGDLPALVALREMDGDTCDLQPKVLLAPDAAAGDVAGSSVPDDYVVERVRPANDQPERQP